MDQNDLRRKALMEQMAGGNTGIAGATDVSKLAPPPAATAAPLPASPVADAPAAPRPNVTSLLEGDPAKLASQEHIAKSPKYQFLSEAQGYGRGQEGDLLKSLQSKYGQFWNGVTFDGKGNFDVNNSDPAWDGVKHVDAYGGYNDGGALKARWGVENPNAPQQAAPQGGGAPTFGGGDAQSNIAAQLAAMTKQSPNLAALIAQLGGQQ